MPLDYTIVYRAENQYQHIVKNAVWQFLIIPENNDNQEVIDMYFNNSLNIPYEYSINSHGFRTIRVHPRIPFKEIDFEASFVVQKQEVNPFDFSSSLNPTQEKERLSSIAFRADFEPFLKKTRFTTIPANKKGLFVFDATLSLFDNLQALNKWVFRHITFKTGVTTVNSSLAEIIDNREGVCQDFAHLFCALARQNGVPARYVSGYLHQGSGYFGDSQMHAWSEVYLPQVGWIGFDPTNEILVSTDHIKVAHGKEYKDCAPIKGVIYATGENQTTHTVAVSAQQ